MYQEESKKALAAKERELKEQAERIAALDKVSTAPS